MIKSYPQLPLEIQQMIPYPINLIMNTLDLFLNLKDWNL